jgi:hypothetical protein
MANPTRSTPRSQAGPKQKFGPAPANPKHLNEGVSKTGSAEQDARVERLANAFEEAIAAVGNGEHLLWLLRTSTKA